MIYHKTKSKIEIIHFCYGHGSHGHGKVCLMLQRIYEILKDYPDDEIKVDILETKL